MNLRLASYVTKREGSGKGIFRTRLKDLPHHYISICHNSSKVNKDAENIDEEPADATDDSTISYGWSDLGFEASNCQSISSSNNEVQDIALDYAEETEMPIEPCLKRAGSNDTKTMVKNPRDDRRFSKSVERRTSHLTQTHQKKRPISVPPRPQERSTDIKTILRHPRSDRRLSKSVSYSDCFENTILEHQAMDGIERRTSHLTQTPQKKRPISVPPRPRELPDDAPLPDNQVISQELTTMSYRRPMSVPPRPRQIDDSSVMDSQALSMKKCRNLATTSNVQNSKNHKIRRPAGSHPMRLVPTKRPTSVPPRVRQSISQDESPPLDCQVLSIQQCQEWATMSHTQKGQGNTIQSPIDSNLISMAPKKRPMSVPPRSRQLSKSVTFQDESEKFYPGELTDIKGNLLLRLAELRAQVEADEEECEISTAVRSICRDPSNYELLVSAVLNISDHDDELPTIEEDESSILSYASDEQEEDFMASFGSSLLSSLTKKQEKHLKKSMKELKTSRRNSSDILGALTSMFGRKSRSSK